MPGGCGAGLSLVLIGLVGGFESPSRLGCVKSFSTAAFHDFSWSRSDTQSLWPPDIEWFV